MTKISAIIILFSLIALGCSSEKKSEDSSALNRNQKSSVDSKVSTNGDEEVKSHDRWTTVQGKIVFTNPTFDPSTGIQNIQLLKNEKVVGQASSSPDGNFEFKGKFENGEYLVKVDSKTLVGSAPLTISGYKVEDFVLPAALTAPKK